MWNLNCPWFKWSFLSLVLLATALVAKPMQAQGGPSVYVNGTEIRGYPEDWSHHYVVFSNIGAEDEALQKREYEHWQKVVNEPRYVIQQLKNHGEMKGPAGIDAEYRSRWNAESTDLRFGEPDRFVPMYRRMTKSNIKTDWSEALGGPGLAAGQYPAKFNVMTTTASCSDYVVFPTGASGSTSHATIVAFNSVYSGCPLFSGGHPVVYWAYNTGNGSTATTSPTISLDGTQVAFVQTRGTTASLVLLKMAASSGTVGAPIAPLSVAVGSYRTCAAPCYTSISLGANDTASAPFYVYGTTDTLYVGDDNGKVHEVTGAFLGTPTLDPAGWPATASTTGAPALSSPVYDSGGSNRIFVTDAGGYLHSFTVAAPGTVTTSGRLENNTTNVFGPPVVDSSAEKVYTFIGYSGDTGHTGNPSYINFFAAAALGQAGSGTGGTNYGTGVPFANGGTHNPATSNMPIGSFDNLYYEGTGTTGNIYVCENGVLYQIPLATITTPVVNVYSTPVTTPGTASACAPVTEFVGTKVATTLSAAITTTTTTTIHVTSGTNIANSDFLQIDSEIMQVSSGGGSTSLTVTRGQQGTSAATHANGAATQDIKDWLFTAVAGGASGSATRAAGCTGACVFNYQVMSAGTTGNPTAGLNSTGGTSGIIIDTSSTAISGDEEIYYTQLGGTSAIQVSQAGLQ
jgi:hypothetical protein